MPLTHVMGWNPKGGYRRVTIEEAIEMYPYETVSAASGIFVCELCMQNVCLTAPGVNVRHFRHSSAEQNKECEERQQSYSRSIISMSNHNMPIRIQKCGELYILQLGFFSPTKTNSYDIFCSKITITCDHGQKFEYSFERVESTGITYFDVGTTPSYRYIISYDGASQTLKNYWPESTAGVNPKGSFFDKSTGKMIPVGGKAVAGKAYYLLQKSTLFSYQVPKGIMITQINGVNNAIYGDWKLYEVRILEFNRYVAKFFLDRGVFLTEQLTDFYPIWPIYVEDPYFIYQSKSAVFFYMCGDSAELRTFPVTYGYQAPKSVHIDNGKLYRIQANTKEQLISLGVSGALGFSYLQKMELTQSASLPNIIFTDINGNELNGTRYTELPKSKCVIIKSKYDGKVSVYQKGKITHIYFLSANEDFYIDGITWNTEIVVFQGQDVARRIEFYREIRLDSGDADEALLVRLKACCENSIPIPHSMGAVMSKLKNYPKTNNWLCTTLKRKKINRDAYRVLQNFLLTGKY